MEEYKIIQQLDRLSKKAERRMAEADLVPLPNHTSYNFLTDEEKQQRYKLLLRLPSSGKKVNQAKERIRIRIQNRNNKIARG